MHWITWNVGSMWCSLMRTNISTQVDTTLQHDTFTAWRSLYYLLWKTVALLTFGILVNRLVIWETTTTIQLKNCVLCRTTTHRHQLWTNCQQKMVPLVSYHHNLHWHLTPCRHQRKALTSHQYFLRWHQVPWRLRLKALISHKYLLHRHQRPCRHQHNVLTRLCRHQVHPADKHHFHLLTLHIPVRVQNFQMLRF